MQDSNCLSGDLPLNCLIAEGNEVPKLSADPLLPVKDVGPEIASELDVIAEAETIVRYIRSGHLAVLAAYQRTASVIKRIGGDPDSLSRFAQVFVSHGILTRDEARLGRASKLSMFAKIGECADVWAMPEVCTRLPSAYSVLYQAALLYETLQGDPATKLAAFICILEAYDGEGEVTRAYLIRKRKELENRKGAAETDSECAGGGSIRDCEGSAAPDNKLSGDAQLPNVSSPSLTPQSDERRAQLLLLTPSDRDWKRLCENYADPSAIGRALPLMDSAADDAVLIVACRVRDLPTIDQLLPHWGLGAIAHVIQTSMVEGPDLIDAPVFAIAEQQAGTVRVPDARSWFDACANLGAVGIADLLVPEAKYKIHVFATAKSEGWISRIGDDAWAKEPSLR